MRRSRSLRWLCALVWVPLALLAVSASSFSALRCTMSGLFIPEGCPLADGAGAPAPSNGLPALDAPGCCERVTISNDKSPAAGASRLDAPAPRPAPLLVALATPAEPLLVAPARARVSIRPPGRSAPAFLLTHAFLI